MDDGVYAPHDDVHQAYPVEHYEEDNGYRRLRRMTQLAPKPEPRATADRYVRRVKIEEVSTNDSTVSLHGAMRSTYEFMRLIFGVAAAGGVAYVLGDAVSFMLKVAAGLVAYVVVFWMFKSKSNGGDEDGKGR